ncbi:MAG: hypothetical protein E6J42_10685 [Chloroflexi bacterium]|nr:MAG: hypothetical protein E6J42_10685 [Chloroflexota bacterium]
MPVWVWMRKNAPNQATVGQPCLATPLRHGEFCLWHSPDHLEEAAEARRGAAAANRLAVTTPSRAWTRWKASCG